MQNEIKRRRHRRSKDFIKDRINKRGFIIGNANLSALMILANNSKWSEQRFSTGLCLILSNKKKKRCNEEDVKLLANIYSLFTDINPKIPKKNLIYRKFEKKPIITKEIEEEFEQNLWQFFSKILMLKLKENIKPAEVIELTPQQRQILIKPIKVVVGDKTQTVKIKKAVKKKKKAKKKAKKKKKKGKK